MKIAWLTPFSRRSAIGQFSATIVAALQSRADVTVFASDLAHAADPECWLPELDVRGMRALTQGQVLAELTSFDLCVYQLGDNLEFHRAIFEIARELPGITVLHDVVMHHFFSEYFLVHRMDSHGYIDEVTFSHGAEGHDFARMVLSGTDVNFAQNPALLRFNMAKSAVHRSEGVVVHSAFAYQTLAPEAECPVIHIPFPTPRIAAADSTSPSLASRSESGNLKLLTFGMINPNKLVAEVIEAIAAHPGLRNRVEYRIIGSLANSGYVARVRDAIAKGGLEHAVLLLGPCPEAELNAAIAEADLIVNLRNPHFGESSWSLLEASFAGKPSLVWRHGFYDEFPDDTVAKIADLSEIGTRIEELSRDRTKLRALGEQARAFASQAFSTTRYCDRLLGFAEQTRYNRPLLRLTDTVATRLRELGQAAGSHAMTFALSEIVALIGDARNQGSPVQSVAAGGQRDT